MFKLLFRFIIDSMSNRLVDVIGEQFDFGFTGKTNVLDRRSNQFLGVIYQIDGMVVKCSYKGASGKNGLLRALYDSLMLTTIRYVSEPEILEESISEFSLSKPDMLRELQEFLKDNQESQKLKPPGHLKLVISPTFFISGPPVLPREFDLLKLLTEYAKVSDIYSNSDKQENEVTQGLIGLRRKGAISVVSDT